jgi:hypothetical protein
VSSPYIFAVACLDLRSPMFCSTNSISGCSNPAKSKSELHRERVGSIGEDDLAGDRTVTRRKSAMAVAVRHRGAAGSRYGHCLSHLACWRHCSTN